MKRIFTAKPFVNKNNNQISFAIPKNKLVLFKKRIPELLKFKIEKVEWRENG